MSTLLTKWVWVERVMVLLTNIAVNLGVASTTQESTVSAGGIIGVVVFVQIVLACVSHWRTLDAKLRADVQGILTSLLGTAPVPSLDEIAASQTDPNVAAALRAGKALPMVDRSKVAP